MKGNTMKETKLQRDIRLLRAQVARLEMQRNGALAALVNAEVKLPGLRKTLDRLRLRQASKLCGRPVPDAGVAKDPLPGPAVHVAEDRSDVNDAPVVQEKPGDKPLAGQLDELEIPTYLKRSPLAKDVAEAAYAVANSHNKAPTVEQRRLVEKEKRRVREEHKQAALTGKLRKPPLTGREAERFLRGR
jgi:hypothetical protein